MSYDVHMFSCNQVMYPVKAQQSSDKMQIRGSLELSFLVIQL